MKEVSLNCMVCGIEFVGEEPKYCCSGQECGCMGQPVDPIVCSEECYNHLIGNNSNTLEIFDLESWDNFRQLNPHHMQQRDKYIEAFKKQLPEEIANRAINACWRQGWPSSKPPEGLIWLIDTFEWTKTLEGWDYWHKVSYGHFDEANALLPTPSPNYRALYEQEKAMVKILHSALNMIAESPSPCNEREFKIWEDVSRDEAIKAIIKYEQLKQQYGQDII